MEESGGGGGGGVGVYLSKIMPGWQSPVGEGRRRRGSRSSGGDASGGVGGSGSFFDDSFSAAMPSTGVTVPPPGGLRLRGVGDQRGNAESWGGLSDVSSMGANRSRASSVAQSGGEGYTVAQQEKGRKVMEFVMSKLWLFGLRKGFFLYASSFLNDQWTRCSSLLPPPVLAFNYQREWNSRNPPAVVSDDSVGDSTA